jgi:hypothetical protein
MVFLELRKQFLDIKANLPNWYAKEDMDKWPPYDYDSDDWRPLETYWQHTFNEWFITQKLDSLVLNRLWRLFYRDAIKAALEFRPLRFMATRLTHSQSEFGIYCRVFREELDELWRKSRPGERRNICDGFECKECNSACQETTATS